MRRLCLNSINTITQLRQLLNILAFTFIFGTAYAQIDSSKQKLPFAIADEKKLSEEDLANKKEGTYITGVPDISSDPVNGFGLGIEGELFFNGKKSDPFFEYTPYRQKLGITLFYTTKLQREVKLSYDVPYIFNTKWRLRVEAAYEVNPNLLYFGHDEKSLNGLSTNGKEFSSYDDYTEALSGKRPGDLSKGEATVVTDAFYNTYQKDEAIFNGSMEHSYLDSKLRLLGGYELAWINISTFDNKITSGNEVANGQSLLQKDNNNFAILGLGSNIVSFLQAGIVYDTRDLEPDPSKGIFAELTNEFSNQVIGSKFNFNKTFAHAKFYTPLFPKTFKRLILAARAGIGYTAGDAPFFEYQDQWSSEGSIEGLGGAHTIRGYKQSRFLARVMNFANLELRWRFAQTTFLKQHLAFSAVPFMDAGGVANDFQNITLINNYRYAGGIGTRIAWNVSTILRFDYAISKEDKQFFFNVGHVF